MICIDSDCVIDFLKGKDKAINIVEKYKQNLATTEINVFEILFGIYANKNLKENERKYALEFFNSINILSFDKPCGDISAKILASLIAKRSAIDQNDCFIGGIMIKNNIDKIITGNKKHFSKIEGIKVIEY